MTLRMGIGVILLTLGVLVAVIAAVGLFRFRRTLDLLQATALVDTLGLFLVTAGLPEIKVRFARRMGGALPPPVEAMLERKHGCFDGEAHDLHVSSGQTDLGMVCGRIRAMVSAG